MNQKLFFCYFSLIVGIGILIGTYGTLYTIKDKKYEGTGIIINKFLKDESDGSVLILVATISHKNSIYPVRILESNYNYNMYRLGDRIDIIYNITNDLEVEALIKPKKYINFVYYFFIVIGIMFLINALKFIFDPEIIKAWNNYRNN